jgi:hypothetical protein
MLTSASKSLPENRDLTPARYPDALHHEPQYEDQLHAITSELVQRVSDVKNESSRSDVEKIRTNANRHLAASSEALANHSAAHRAGDVRASVFWMSEAANHTHNAINYLKRTNWAREGFFNNENASPLNVDVSGNIHERVGGVVNSYTKSLKRHGWNDSQMLDSGQYNKSYTPGVDVLTHKKVREMDVTPSSEPAPKKVKTEEEENQAAVDKFQKAKVRNIEGGIGIASAPGSNWNLFNRRLVETSVGRHWKTTNPDKPIPDEVRTNPLDYARTNKVPIPLPILDAYLTKEDSEQAVKKAGGKTIASTSAAKKTQREAEVSTETVPDYSTNEISREDIAGPSSSPYSEIFSTASGQSEDIKKVAAAQRTHQRHEKIATEALISGKKVPTTTKSFLGNKKLKQMQSQILTEASKTALATPFQEPPTSGRSKSVFNDAFGAGRGE